MTLIYIPQLIETAEQAEALAEGTVAIGTRYGVIEKGSRGRWWAGLAELPDRIAVGGTALVPIEAEEEFFLTRDGVPFGLPMDEAAARTDAARNAHRGAGVARRWTTEWEPVTDPDRRGDCA